MNKFAATVLWIITNVSCAETRSGIVTHPDACGSHVECFNKSLLNLDDARKLLVTAQQQALGLVPAGTVVAFAGSKAPEGWMFCDGRFLDKNEPKFQRLFDAIGTSYGGDANPNFQTPDYRGLFLRGVDGGTNRDPESVHRVASEKKWNWQQRKRCWQLSIRFIFQSLTFISWLVSPSQRWRRL